MKIGLLFLTISFYFMAPALAAGFKSTECQAWPISKGEGGEGVIRHCVSGDRQQIYLSGEMDVGDDDNVDCEGSARDRRRRDCRDYRTLLKVVKKIKKLSTGTFELITKNAGGGDVSWHQKLIMAVEDACQKDCRMSTRLKGFCESACAQLHLTCAQHAQMIMEQGSRYCEHATNDSDSCHFCDKKLKGEPCHICDPKETVKEYTDRCDTKALLKGRSVVVDKERAQQVQAFAEKLRRDGVFSSDKFECVIPPWARVQGQEQGQAPTDIGQ